ncbi:MAG: GNAT family N-acetyltransferase, partial [Planctomycetes bacterium]|nr:GNAT family N-acetyltransferase [Planctomycetota bacterium]
MESIRPSSSAVDPLNAPDSIRSILIEKGTYRLRVATNSADVHASCKLRFQVFNLEMSEGLASSYKTGLDQDAFDRQCHHLIVENKGQFDSEHRIVGTYRLQTVEAAQAGAGFYSANEFHLDDLPDGLISQAVELGRACIAPNHRNRSVLLLLWKGLCAYIEATKKRYFFGCNSLNTQDTSLGWSTYHWLVQKGHARSDFLVRSTEAFRCAESDEDYTVLSSVKI